MGAIKPWQLLCCSTVCLLVVTGIIAAVVLAVRKRRSGPDQAGD